MALFHSQARRHMYDDLCFKAAAELGLLQRLGGTFCVNRIKQKK